MKIVIAGASIGGLLAAYQLGRFGNDVVVFEEKDYDRLGYDWYDFVWPDFFDKLNADGAEISFYRKPNMSFDIFGHDKIIRLNQSGEEREYAVNRRDLSHFLYKRASQYARIHLSTHVDSLILDKNSVKGVIAGGSAFSADLVIDNLGVFSPLRKELPAAVNIEREIKKENILFAYRVFFRRNELCAVEDDTKCYLRHLGQDGISWVNVENDKIDVLIGRTASLSMKEAETILTSLRQENAYIGERLSGGDRIHAIPVRHPATKLFCDGYAMIGDSGCMTVPLLGSGMYSSAVAANVLSDILKEGTVSEKKLYSYQ
jgi:flavin-dependent dehydrogenase